ncbi:hypothetical protein [Escherichia coli]|uniref:hypothetical protein n=1 Tax=Escherichia coli TaxID=562 RepID=UPI002897050A|nr:hypothetical protein [Escherichia coli]
MRKIKHDALKGILMQLEPGEAFQLNPETLGFVDFYRLGLQMSSQADELVRYVRKQFGVEMISLGKVQGIHLFIFKPNKIRCFTLME